MDGEPKGAMGGTGSGASPGLPRASSPPASAAEGETRTARLLLSLAALAALVLALGLPQLASTEHTYGWDESMHVALPAAQLAVALEEGRPEVFAGVLLDCEQYPFVFPLAVAGAQLVGGLGEPLARGSTLVLLALCVIFVGLLAGRLARPGGEASMRAAAQLAGVLVVTSPMAEAFGRTLFLEVPFLSMSAAALVAWTARREGSRGRDLLAGVLLGAALFTKFNYGLLLLAGLLADEGLSLFSAARAGRLASRRASTLRVLAPVALVCLWWFVLPLPGGMAEAASHRQALLGFLGGNLELAATGPARKWLHFLAYLAPSPAAGLLLGVGLVAGLRHALREPAVRAVALALLALALPMLLHPFHLERFWLPTGVGLWSLAALGWVDLASLLRRSSGSLRRVPLLTLPLLLLALCHWNAPGQAVACARALGQVPDDPAAVAAARQVFGGWVGPRSERVVPTAGLRREEAEELLDLMAAEVGPEESYGWPGLSSELSPGMLALGIHRRGGSPARLFQVGEPSIDVAPTPGAALPGWDDGTLEAWAQQFDMLFFTDPPDVKDRASRREVKERLHRRLVEGLGWAPTRLGVVKVDRGAGEPLEVGLFVCRRP